MSKDKDRRTDARRFAKVAKDKPDEHDTKEAAMRIFAKKGEGADAARIIVRPQSGVFEIVDPELIRGRHQDVLIWFCENQTSEPIKIKLLEFRELFSQTEFEPIEFQSANPIEVLAGKTAIMHGKLIRDPKIIEFFKYKIRVIRSDGSFQDLDPDLEIKP